MRMVYAMDSICMVQSNSIIHNNNLLSHENGICYGYGPLHLLFSNNKVPNYKIKYGIQSSIT